MGERREKVEPMNALSELVAGVRQGLASMDVGQGEVADVVFERLEQKYPFLRSP